MSCASLPTIPYPPGLDLLLPTLSLSVPSLAIDFCCSFETPPIPGFPIVIPLGTLIPAGAAVILQAVVTVIIEAIDTLNSLLDELQFSCPLE